MSGLLAIGGLLFCLCLGLSVAGFAAPEEAFVGLPVIAAYGISALIVARRQPRNLVGWILAGIVVGVGLSSASLGYVEGSDDPATLPLGVLAVWVAQWAYVVWISLAVLFLPLLFPTGRLPSPSWRPVAWLALVALVLGAVSEATMPTLEVDTKSGGSATIANPIGLGQALVDILYLTGNVLLVVSVIGAIASLVARLRSAGGRERQQVKWVAWTLGLGAAGITVAVIAASFEPADGVAEGSAAVVYVMGVIGWFGALAVLGLGVPAAIAVAIVRYRLYDIDVIINRTLVYGALTALLVVVYVGSVVSLQGALRAMIGQGSQLAIVASTLAVAALFNSLRRRIQAFVDRRFYRRKYDARKTLEVFSGKLRDETSLDALNDELVEVVRGTMQPAHVSLWLRSDTPKD
ncbi:MAG TPA: hypothetical protein VK869_05370 [Rubrobacteraceae bacterium]|nr:hypothetical protein [Rubrobacteraceae bacterium]